MLLFTLISQAVAGLGPPDVLVLANAQSPEALAVAAAYRDARDLRNDQICAVSGVDPDALSLSFAGYAQSIGPALDDCLAGLPDPDEIDALVLVRGLPYRVDLDAGFTSLEAMLQVRGGLWGDTALEGRDQRLSGSTPYASVANPVFVGSSAQAGDFDVSNDYAASYFSTSDLIREDWPGSFVRVGTDLHTGVLNLDSALFVVSRLDGFDHQDALDLVDRGLAADGAMPTEPMVCMAAKDSARGARDPECELAVRMLDAAGVPALWIDTYDAALSDVSVSAYWSGSASHAGAIDGVDYAPGAFADNLTSYGAVPGNFVCSEDGSACPESESQTSVARFVRAGATAAHGTVAEPLNNSFPHAGTLLMYGLGYSLGESVLYNQRYLYWQNLLLGDPLTAPFAERPVVSVPAEVPYDAPLVVSATHPDGISSIRISLYGLVLDETSGDTLEVVLPGNEGTVHQVLVEARSGPRELVVADWPGDAVWIHPETTGWIESQVILTASQQPGDSAQDSGGPGYWDEDPGPGGGGGASKGGQGGCSGCLTAPAPAALGLWMGGLLVTAGLRRRKTPVRADMVPPCSGLRH